MSDKRIIVEFESPISSEELQSSIKESFPDGMIFKSNGASGLEVVILFLSSAPFLISKLLDFYIKNKDRSKTTKVKIPGSNGAIELEGLSVKQIKELIESGSLEELKKLTDKTEHE